MNRKLCQIIIISKPRISVAFVQDIYHYIHYFSQKGKLVLRSLLLEGRYFRGDPYFQDLLTLATFHRYFQRFATFEGSLILELYSNIPSLGILPDSLTFFIPLKFFA